MGFNSGFKGLIYIYKQMYFLRLPPEDFKAKRDMITLELKEEARYFTQCYIVSLEMLIVTSFVKKFCSFIETVYCCVH